MKKLVIGIVGVMVLAFAAQSQAVGTGTLDKVSGWFPAGTNLTVIATPAADSDFKDWTGSATGTDPQISFTVDGAKALTATFILKTYQVVFNEGLYGTLSGSATQTVSHGSSAVAPTITDDPGYAFAGWDTLAYTNVTSTLAVTALYSTNSYTLTFDSAGGSSVADITQAFGTTISAPTAPTRTGYTFTSWDPEIPPTMPVDGGSFTAQWTANDFKLVVYSAHGTSSPAVGTNWYSYNDTVNFAMPDSPVIIVNTSKYDATGWVGTGSLSSGSGTNGSFTITNDTTLTWTWTTNYWVELNVAGE